MKKLYIFDLDGTLTESKQPMTHEMALYLAKLLKVATVGIISGGALAQFMQQVVDRLPRGANLENLYLLPTSGAAFYEFQNGEWKKIYEERISERDAHAIEKAIHEAAEETGIINFSKPAYGERIEYRGSQVTLSALGQQAPLVLKKSWDVDHAKRRALQTAIAKRLPDFSVSYGGKTSIDINKPGIDKAYGIRKLCERTGVPEAETLYIGDELGAGGNDEAVYKTKAATCAVADAADTLRTLKTILTAA